MQQPEFCGPCSYNRGNTCDVKPFFTSIPVDPALDIICGQLHQDPILHTRTPFSIHNIITLLDFCLKSMFLMFQGKFYEQVQGAPMGSPISPLMGSLFTEDFKVRALSTSHPPKIWLRYMDDTFFSCPKGRTLPIFPHPP